VIDRRIAHEPFGPKEGRDMRRGVVSRADPPHRRLFQYEASCSPADEIDIFLSSSEVLERVTRCNCHLAEFFTTHSSPNVLKKHCLRRISSKLQHRREPPVSYTFSRGSPRELVPCYTRAPNWVGLTSLSAISGDVYSQPAPGSIR